MPISSTVTFLYTRGSHVGLSQPGDIIESDGTVNLHSEHAPAEVLTGISMLTTGHPKRKRPKSTAYLQQGDAPQPILALLPGWALFMSARLMSGLFVLSVMTYALVGVTLEQSLLTEKSSIVGFNSIVGPVSEGLSTENV